MIERKGKRGKSVRVIQIEGCLFPVYTLASDHYLRVPFTSHIIHSVTFCDDGQIVKLLLSSDSIGLSLPVRCVFILDVVGSLREVRLTIAYSKCLRFVYASISVPVLYKDMRFLSNVDCNGERSMSSRERETFVDTGIS